MEASTEPATNNELQALEEKISLLTELSTRVDTLRQTPSYLRLGAVAPSTSPIASNVAPGAQATLIRQGFDGIRQFSDKVQSEAVQDILKQARESESNDKSDLNFNHPRKNLKRKYVPFARLYSIFEPLVTCRSQ